MHRNSQKVVPYNVVLWLAMTTDDPSADLILPSSSSSNNTAMAAKLSFFILFGPRDERFTWMGKIKKEIISFSMSVCCSNTDVS